MGIYYTLISIAGTPLGSTSDLGIPRQELNAVSLSSMLNAVYFVAGIVAVIVIIIAGINYAASGGDASKVSKAKNMLIYSIVGIVVVMSAFVITNFVIGRLR